MSYHICNMYEIVQEKMEQEFKGQKYNIAPLQ